MSADKAKVVILQVIMPETVPAHDLLPMLNVAFQNYMREKNILCSPLDWNVSILSKLGLDRRETT